ncbi:MAG: hypothetical protein HYZ73_01165 [Elusimicrobia bacterium]|nr:hypothetical protein [Elusimicrobiota bacterium]
MKRSARTVLAIVTFAGMSGASLSHAKDPIRVLENGVWTSISQDGIIAFAKDYEKNPRDLTLEILDHPFTFDVTPDACGTNCTSLRFISTELRIDKTFTGANTDAVSTALKDYLKREEFLTPFIRLINSGAGAQLSGSPVGSIGSTVKATFHDVIFSPTKTFEERQHLAVPGTDPTISSGYGQFKNSGFEGSVISVSPGFALDFGARKDKHLKFSIPTSRIDLEGLRTYRSGLILQYLHPVYFRGHYTLTVGPGLSYLATVSKDLPNFSGLLGGAFSVSLTKDWERYLGTLGSYYGHFNNLGGLDTDINANIYGWGVQTGYRLSQRMVVAIYLVGMHERVNGFSAVTYHTMGTSFSYKVLNRFNLTISANRLFGLPDNRLVDYGLGSAWFF